VPARYFHGRSEGNILAGLVAALGYLRSDQRGRRLA
jgi:hypothetical protein